MKLETLIWTAGLLHFGVLIASALVPNVLDWRTELARLSTLTRQLVWVHGIFIVLVIIGFGALSMLNASTLTGGTALARTLCGFIAFFWGARLSLQFVLFDRSPHVKSALLMLGHHGLTVVFSFFTLVFGWAALAPHHAVLHFGDILR